MMSEDPQGAAFAKVGAYNRDESPIPSSELSPQALAAIRVTRRLLWTLCGVAVLCVPNAMFNSLGLILVAEHFDRGYTMGMAFFELTEIPVSCVCFWQLIRFDRALSRVAKDGQLDPLLLAQRQFLLIVSVALVSYWLFCVVGSRLLIGLVK
jgi:hypothetical protein